MCHSHYQWKSSAGKGRTSCQRGRCFTSRVDLDTDPLQESFKLSSATIVTASEMFLQPQIQTDKHVTAAHFLNLQFRYPRAPAAPGDWDRGPRVTADDGFEGQLDSDVEMWGN
jgi:hypothetical protein